MKTGYLLPALLLSVVCFLPACEYDKHDTLVIYYTSDEYEVLTQNLNLPSIPFDYSPKEFSSEALQNMGTLGRVLFYDNNLSLDNSVSCGSCHQQNLGFADNVAFSKGIMNRSTARNTLALGAFTSFDDYSGDPQTTLFWDGRVNNLHDQMIQTIKNPNEMGLEMSEITAKIKNLDYYKILTKKAFGTETINEGLILLALEKFMNSITSKSSKLDAGLGNIVFNTSGMALQGFNDQENLGLNLFSKNCAGCHRQGLEFLPVFTGTVRSANNGLDLVYADKGAGAFDNDPSALAVFKVPGLKNIELTAPYMHDGRFNTLEEVVDFYSTGIQDHPNLNFLLKENDQPKRFNFTATEKDALVQFLKTFTDHTMTAEEKWSDPFL